MLDSGDWPARQWAVVYALRVVPGKSHNERADGQLCRSDMLGRAIVRRPGS